VKSRPCVARADELAAAGAAAAVFVLQGFGEVDVVDVGRRHEPGRDVGEFLFDLPARALTQGGRRFSDLLLEPEEGGRCAALAVRCLQANQVATLGWKCFRQRVPNRHYHDEVQTVVVLAKIDDKSFVVAPTAVGLGDSRVFEG